MARTLAGTKRRTDPPEAAGCAGGVPAAAASPGQKQQLQATSHSSMQQQQQQQQRTNPAATQQGQQQQQQPGAGGFSCVHQVDGSRWQGQVTVTAAEREALPPELRGRWGLYTKHYGTAEEAARAVDGCVTICV